MTLSRDSALSFMHTVIEPAIQVIHLWSPAAAVLLLGTAIQESQLCYRRQIGGGPALGLFQMEPATHDDCWYNYLSYRPSLASQVMKVARRSEQPEAEWLVTHDDYAAAMARIKYLRAPAPLPDALDIPAMASYWTQFYNAGGTGTPQKYLDNWHAVMGDEPI